MRVVNCARGGLINENDLAAAIKEGIVASAGIDVLVDEPKPISPLIDLPECVLTPHLGADTTEAQDNVGIAIAEELCMEKWCRMQSICRLCSRQS